MFLAPQGVNGLLRASGDPILDFFILIRSKKKIKYQNKCIKIEKRGTFLYPSFSVTVGSTGGPKWAPKRGPWGSTYPEINNCLLFL